MTIKAVNVILVILFALSALADSRAIKHADNISELNKDSLFSVSAALVAGVYNYEGGWPDLPGVKTDLDTVSEMLSSRGFLVERADNLTKAEFFARYDRFISDYADDPTARLLIYYAGHGHTLTENSEKNGYIVLKDAARPSENRDGFLSGSIPIAFFSSHASDIRSKQVLFMFDSCFSGTVFSAMRSIPELITELLKKPVRQFITSGSEDQMVPDVSIFRRRFVTALSGDADQNMDSVITGSELGEYLRRSVSQYTSGTQTPVHGKMLGFEGEFLFFNDVPSIEASEPPRKEMSGEKEELLAIIKKNPHSPDASKALERLREIDDSLKNMPPVLAPERKDFVMKAKSMKRVNYDSDEYPYIILAPFVVPAMDRQYKAAFRIKAKNMDTFTKLNERKAMISSVLSRRLKESNLQLVSDIIKVRKRIKQTAGDAVEWVCPDCIETQPAIAGLMGL